MKKILFWIANLFHIDLSVERVVIKEVVKEIKVPYEVIKEVEKIVEIPSEKIVESNYTSGDLTINGNLIVNGYLKVDKEITCYKLNTK